jgi:hypothetical protein
MTSQYQHGSLLGDPAERQGTLRALKEIDFELAYLAALTSKGLKPLSRWEKTLAEDDLELLRQLGLLTKQIDRTVRTGRQVTETIFSRASIYMQLYEQAFGNTPIDKSARTQLFEGFLFGYPSCCVSQYIRKPYAPNNLTRQQQKILFHWACPNCKVTPLLLPAYQAIRDLLDRW